MKNLEKDATNPTKKPKKVITKIIEIKIMSYTFIFIIYLYKNTRKFIDFL